MSARALSDARQQVSFSRFGLAAHEELLFAVVIFDARGGGYETSLLKC
jgi:hypothetical protein